MNITPLELYELIKLVAESKTQGEYIDRFPPFINRQYKDEEESGMAKICDDYCRFPRDCCSDDDLVKICDSCMINNLIKRRQK